MPSSSTTNADSESKAIEITTKRPNFISDPRYLKQLPQYLINTFDKHNVFSEDYKILYEIAQSYGLSTDFSLNTLNNLLLHLHHNKSLVLVLKTWVTNNKIFNNKRIFTIITKLNDSSYILNTKDSTQIGLSSSNSVD